jgi:glycosyltransferase involved in cell wall biosynthesis
MTNVSVIVPNYNHAPYLHQRIESILNQTYQDYELILLDDCSTDNSRAILLEYQNHPKVSNIVFNDENGGNTFKQWHKGIELAKGKYIWLAESDDWADSSFLEILVNQIESTIVLAFCQSFRIDKNGNIVSEKILSDEIIIKDGKSFIVHELTTGNAIYNASMCIFKKSAYIEVSRERYDKMKYCGDWFLWSLLCEQGDVVELKKQLNYFRQHDKNVSGSAERNGLTIFEGFNIFLYNRKYVTSTLQYLKMLIIWAQKWIGQPYTKNINNKIMLYFLHNSPLIVIIYLVIYFPVKIKHIISSCLKFINENLNNHSDI